MKILALHLQTFIEYAHLRGMTRQECVADMKPIDFQSETATVEADDFYKVVETINASLQDNQLGLRLGEFLSLNSLGLIYQISMQATTVEEALFYLNNYLSHTLPMVQTAISATSERAVIQLDIAYSNPKIVRIILENILSVIAKELSMMTTQSANIQVFSPHYESDYPANWQLGKRFELTFTPVVLKAALQDMSRLHLDILVPEYLKLIESLNAGHSFTSKVKLASLHMARPELPDLEQIADVFHLTPRTLQRRLSTENSTFRQIIDELKKQLSYMLMQHNRFSVTDVSYVLGYSEPAAFIHSFKKWYGNSPEKMRGKTLSP